MSLARSMTGRLVVRAVAVLLLAATVVVLPQDRAQAAATVRSGLSTSVSHADLCSVEEWRVAPSRCLDQLNEVADVRLACLSAPTPETPDAGMGGWFAQRPEA